MIMNMDVHEYIKKYKALKENPDFKAVKIALLSSFTISGIKEILAVNCCEKNINADIYVGDYNQYAQEILDDSSGLYAHKPDVIFIFVDTKSLLGENYLGFYQLSKKDVDEIINETSKQLFGLIKKLKRKLKSKIVVHNLEVPSHSPLGIIDNKQKKGFFETIQEINSKLRDEYKKDSQVFVFDYDAFCSRYGKNNVIDYKMYYLGDVKLSLSLLPYLCDEYLAYIIPLMSMTKKAIILDMDNTLWGGIVGEDGLEGIKLGPTPEGRPFLEFQKYLLSLFNRGVTLAVNSNNNLDDALEVLKKHPHMVLKERHFAAMQVNWNDKVSNMKAIAKELNIGLDSLVFFDDDKLSREIIQKALPEVQVVDFPEDPSLLLDTLMNLKDFSVFHLTEEDKKKGKMYADQRKRKELSLSTTDITDFLKALQMQVIIQKADKLNIARISQLTQKTNQFNMTTKRYAQEDIERFAQSKDHLVFSIRVEDKFGDNGITGAAIIEKGKSWIIDTFLLSCRVIGRRIEETMIAYIISQAKKEKANSVTGEFIATKKNTPAKGFYKKAGFELDGEEDNVQKWIFDVSKGFDFPGFIEVVNKDG